MPPCNRSGAALRLVVLHIVPLHNADVTALCRLAASFSPITEFKDVEMLKKNPQQQQQPTKSPRKSNGKAREERETAAEERFSLSRVYLYRDTSWTSHIH